MTWVFAGRDGQDRPLVSRVLRAALTLVINVTVWIILPRLLLDVFAQSATSLSLDTGAFIIFGATITALQVLATLTSGAAISTICSAGSYAVSAFYIFTVANGGDLTITSQGVTAELTFPLLLVLLMLPPIFSVARVALVYLLDESEGSRRISDEVRG
jgi:hypothetical protein